MPIITLDATEPEAIIVEAETLPDNFYSTFHASDVEMQDSVDFDTKTSLLVNYKNITEKNMEQKIMNNSNNEATDDRLVEEHKTESVLAKSDLQDFSARSDGSVNCKLCGKIFASRQHWYRHKYRAHVNFTPPVEPVPLNKCEKCLIFFKSRKGYLGHMSSKHSETLQDVTPVLRNEQAAALAKQDTRISRLLPVQPKAKREPDPEMAIPKTILQNYQAALTPTTRNTRAKNTDKKKAQSTSKAPDEIDPKEYQERRVKDESFVMGIIEKVRRQCETEPEVANRRGYSRKPYSVRI